MLDALDETAAWPIDGYLIASPYYTRPSQRGLVQHFTALADHASWPIVLYNIPYRTAVNLTNETLLQLAEHPNIVGMKDCGADRAQSIEFLSAAAARLSRADRRGRAISRGAHRRRRRRDPAVGASGDRSVRRGADAAEAGRPRRRAGVLGGRFRTDRLLFAEPSPAPAKYWLARSGSDRQRRSAPADGGSERGTGGAAGCGDRAAQAAAVASARKMPIGSLSPRSDEEREKQPSQPTSRPIGQHRREAEHHRPASRTTTPAARPALSGRTGWSDIPCR